MSETYQQYQRRLKADRQKRLEEDPTVAEHGKEATYVGWGCRCSPCRDAAVEARMFRDAKRLGYEVRKVDAREGFGKRGWER